MADSAIKVAVLLTLVFIGGDIGNLVYSRLTYRPATGGQI